MRQYNDPFEQLVAEIVCEIAEEMANPQPIDFRQKKNLTTNSFMVQCNHETDRPTKSHSDSETDR